MANLISICLIIFWILLINGLENDRPIAMKYSDEGSDKEIESKYLRSADYILDERPSRKHNSYSSESNLAGKDKFTSVTILRHGDYELLEAVPADGSGSIRANDIDEFGWLLRDCHHPIQQFMLFGYNLESYLMDFFRGLDRTCFTGQTIALNSVDMGTALLTDWFQELFDGDKAIFRPKHLQLQGLRQVPNDYMNQALVTYSSLISAQKIVLLDFMQLPNVSRHTAEEVAAVCTKIKTSTIVKWLHADSNAAFFGPRIFNIQVELLEDRLVDVIDALFEAFWVDPRPASFFLLAHRNADSVYGESHGWPSLEVTGDGESIGRSAVNTITGEHMHVGVISNKDYTNTNAGGVQLAGDDLYLERYSGSLQQSALYILQESQKMQGPQEKIVPVVLRGD